MYAREIMGSHEPWVCGETDDCRRAAQLMGEHDVGSIPVLDPNGRLEGIVTDRDLALRIVAEGRSFETPLREVMTAPVHSVGLDADHRQVEEIMRQYRIRRLPVVDSDGRLQGMISLADLAEHCHGLFRDHQLVNVLEAVSTP